MSAGGKAEMSGAETGLAGTAAGAVVHGDFSAAGGAFAGAAGSEGVDFGRWNNLVGIGVTLLCVGFLAMLFFVE